MGFFSKWSRKQEKEQLAAVEKKAKVDNSEKKSEKPVKKETNKDVAKTGKSLTGNAFKVLVRPLISEKAAVSESNGVYQFVVNRNSTKVEIKNAIKQVYGVVPLKIRIINIQGKSVRFGRSMGRRSDWKKALVTLSKGQSINIHEGV